MTNSLTFIYIILGNLCLAICILWLPYKLILPADQRCPGCDLEKPACVCHRLACLSIPGWLALTCLSFGSIWLLGYLVGNAILYLSHHSVHHL